jgi:TonB family protein
MKIYLLPLLLLFGSSLLAQTTPYADFEVDSVASPRGGMVFYNTFIQTSLRKPISAQAEGLGGKVILSGIIETDGHIANVNVMKSFRPDCDREAMRVFRLFNAWKPAQKNGQPVRQKVTMLIEFQPNKPFIYKNGAIFTYFGTDSQAIADSTQAKYKQVAPIDSNGVPTGDIVTYESKSKGWKEYYKMPLVRRKHSANGSDRGITYTIGNQNYRKDWSGDLVTVNEAGTILNHAFYREGKRVGSEMMYHSNGSIAEKNDELDEKIAIMTWYPNGQIKQIKTTSTAKTFAPSSELITAFWDSTGQQNVVDGNGRVTYQNQVPSYNDTIQHTFFIEQGLYENGLKQGVWTGRYVDGSYFYEETYEKGGLQAGKARSGGADTVRYIATMQPPEFHGGMKGLGQFLSQNLKYPADAQKVGAQGQVFVSFVVCTDGTLCDYEVLKSVQSDLDREAVRVIQKMSGKWKPGVQRGQKVRVKYNLPINFTLN